MSHFILLFMVVTATTTTTASYAQSTDMFISVNPETNMLVDSMGRERFFHGTNVVMKKYPYYPLSTGTSHVFNEIDMQILQSLGLNSIRLGKA